MNLPQSEVRILDKFRVVQNCHLNDAELRQNCSFIAQERSTLRKDYCGDAPVQSA